MHTPMPGPYDDVACKECTTNVRACYLAYNDLDTLEYIEPIYVPYPCSGIEGDCNVTNN